VGFLRRYRASVGAGTATSNAIVLSMLAILVSKMVAMATSTANS